MAPVAAIFAGSIIVFALVAAPGAFADYAFPLDISKPALASLSSTVTAVSVGDELIIVANAKNNTDRPVNAVFVIQAKNQ